MSEVARFVLAAKDSSRVEKQVHQWTCSDGDGVLLRLNLVQHELWGMIATWVHADSHDTSDMGTFGTRWAATQDAFQGAILVSALVLEDALGLVSGASWHVSWATSSSIALWSADVAVCTLDGSLRLITLARGFLIVAC